MKIIQIFKNRKLLLINIFFSIYIITSFIGGERGIISYFEKKRVQENLIAREFALSDSLKSLEKKINLLSKDINSDYIDILYREKLKFGKKDEIIIKLNNEN